MLAPRDLCENRAVLRHSAMTRATAALLSGLLALSPAAWAGAPKTSVVVLPYASFPGVPEDVAARVAELVGQELKGRDELKLVALEAKPAAKDRVDSVAQAWTELGKAAQLAQKSRHGAAADALQKAISFLMAKPS